MHVKARNGVPTYQRIQGAVRRIITSGGLRPGDAVPSERELARIHEVSLLTARHALATLEREGIVERRRGVGTFASTPSLNVASKCFSPRSSSAIRCLEFSKRSYGVVLGYGDEEVDATAANPHTADLFGAPRREPLLRIRQVIYARNATVIRYVRGSCTAPTVTTSRYGDSARRIRM